MSTAGRDSFSFISSAMDMETIYTPSVSADERSINDQSTDNFDLILEDSEYVDENNDSLDAASDHSTSVSPSIYDHEFGHGRRYHSYKSGRYPMPNDSLQIELEELKNRISTDLMEGHLHFADIGDYPNKILDIGTGGGFWAIDNEHPGASVIGTDLSPVQSSWVPPNLEIYIDDCEEEEWLNGSGFDLVHLGDVSLFLRDAQALFNKAHRHIKPGGWIELQDFQPKLYCDDGTMKEGDPVRQFFDLLQAGMRQLGCHQWGALGVVQSLEQAGFVNVQRTMKKVPLGPWARDNMLRQIGMMSKAFMEGSLHGLGAKPFEALGLSPEESAKVVDEALASLDDNSIHRYTRFWVCYGQKGPNVYES